MAFGLGSLIYIAMAAIAVTPPCTSDEVNIAHPSFRGLWKSSNDLDEKLQTKFLTQTIGEIDDDVHDFKGDGGRRLQVPPDLAIDLDKSPTNLPFESIAPYLWNNGNQDGGGSIEILPNGSSIKLLGNVWKSFPIPTYSVTSNTVMEFDLQIPDMRNYHGICLDVDQDGFRNLDSGPGTCFYLGGMSAAPTTWHRVSAPGASFEDRRHFIIDVGGLILPSGQSVRPVRFIAFVTDENSDQTLGEAIFRSIRVHEGDDFSKADPRIRVRTKKSPALLVPNGRTYLWNNGLQDGGGYFDLTQNGRELTFTGNNWKVFAMDTYAVNSDTILEFDLAIPVRTTYHGICLDLDQDAFRNTDSGPATCFYLGGTSGPPSTWIRVNAPGGDFAMSRHYIINAGELIVPASQISRVVRFLGFVSNSDTNVLFGEMTIGNIKIHDGNDFDDDENPRLLVQMRGKKTPVVPNGQNYLWNNGQQDGGGYFDLSPNGKVLTFFGNNWKAFQIEPYSVSPNTVLEFNLLIPQLTGYHGICLDVDLDGFRNSDSGPGTCFYLAGTQRTPSTWTRVSAPGNIAATDEMLHYVIDVGALFGLTSEARRDVSYLAFVSNSDTDAQFGECRFQNVKIHEGKHFDDGDSRLNINVRGVPTTLVPNGLSYNWNNGLEDSVGYFDLNPDGKAISLFGNAWKGFRLDSPYIVRNTTVLEFDLTITTITKGHLICLDVDLDAFRNADGGLKNCFYGGGTWSTGNVWVLDPPPAVGVETRYVIDVGKLILRQGETERTVNFLGFISDSDVDRTFGESTFANMELHDGDKSGGGGGSECEDNLKAKFFLKISAGKKKNCRWLKNKKKGKQRKKICKSNNSDADEVCRALCGTCI